MFNQFVLSSTCFYVNTVAVHPREGKNVFAESLTSDLENFNCQ